MKNAYLLFIILVNASITSGQSGNLGIGTSSPSTKLDVNGAITNREGVAITVSGTAVTVNNPGFSQYRLTGTPTGEFTITGPTTSDATTALVSGARMILVNATTLTGTLNGFSILPGAAQEFTYTNGSWVATNGGIKPDYDWMKAGNQFPANPGDTAQNIYHIGGNVGIGVAAPLAKLDVRSNTHPQFIVSQEGLTNPAGIYGMITRYGAGGAFFGYLGPGNNPSSNSLGEAIVLAGAGKNIAFYTESASQSGDAVDPANAANVNRMTIESETGNVGIAINDPRTTLDVNGPQAFTFSRESLVTIPGVGVYPAAVVSSVVRLVGPANSGNLRLVGMPTGVDGQVLDVLLYNQQGASPGTTWQIIHMQGSLPAGVRPIFTTGTTNKTGALNVNVAARFVYDSLFNGGVWMLVSFGN